MIPEKIVRFMEGATVAIGGTRDRNLVPHVHRVSGWAVSSDRNTITCLIPPHFTSHLLDSLEDNGQFSLTVCEVPSHETYQFKGTYVQSGPVSDADLATFKKQRQRFVERMDELFGFKEAVSRAYVPEPSVKVSFKVCEIFVQTPGPGAGHRLVPPED